MAISSIGVGSGLPLDELLTSLRNSENSALGLIQTRQIAVQNRLSAYGKIQGAMAALKSAADTLADAGTFEAFKSSVSDGAFAASASTQAIAGQYSIKVNDLASAQTLVTSGQVDAAAAIGADGQIQITLGDGTGVKILDLSGKDTSLNGLISAINSDPSLGISATMINDGSGTPFRLLLTAKQTGVNASVAKIEVVGNNSLQTAIGFVQGVGSPNIAETAAQNASIQINGITISSQTNQINDAIQGVSLTLQQINTTASTLTINNDNLVASNAVNAFVSAYNSLQTTIQALTAYNLDTKSSSALTGDSLARRAQNQVRAALNVATSSGSIRSLSQLGIETQTKDGTLKLDSTKLAAALKDNLPDVQALFTGDTGIAKQLSTVADSFLSSGGLLSTATDSVNRTITDLQKQYDATSARIDAKMEVYRQQFTSLDTMMAQMNSVSSYLTQQLSVLGNQGNNK